MSDYFILKEENEQLRRIIKSNRGINAEQLATIEAQDLEIIKIKTENERWKEKNKLLLNLVENADFDRADFNIQIKNLKTENIRLKEENDYFNVELEKLKKLWPWENEEEKRKSITASLDIVHEVEEE